MHIAQGVFKAVNVNKITRSGGQFVFWVADWFALMNDKMGGDLEKIGVVGEYLQEGGFIWILWIFILNLLYLFCLIFTSLFYLMK